MYESNALAASSALAHEHRLRVFRLLVSRSPEGLTAGDIAAHMQLPPSSLSFHLGHLERAVLITPRREQRHILAQLVGAVTATLLFAWLLFPWSVQEQAAMEPAE
jgi:ArsR family transcriptional regulator, arsenate/arsenite/antimonite-responsive transcriptional repressor